jgi:hypothetical protein
VLTHPGFLQASHGRRGAPAMGGNEEANEIALLALRQVGCDLPEDCAIESLDTDTLVRLSPPPRAARRAPRVARLRACACQRMRGAAERSRGRGGARFPDHALRAGVDTVGPRPWSAAGPSAASRVDTAQHPWGGAGQQAWGE